MATSKPAIVKPIEDVTPIAKPETKSGLDRFKAKRTAVTSIETLQVGLPHHTFAAAKDFVHMHPDEDAYWSSDYCFVSVPIKGQRENTLHLIDEDLALRFLPLGKILHFRLALASKPNDIFFLCHIPTRNLDNKYNATTLSACQQAKAQWVQLTSLKEKGIENYELTLAHDPDGIPEPKWPTQPLSELIDKAFENCQIDHEDHPALLRLIGARQVLG